MFLADLFHQNSNKSLKLLDGYEDQEGLMDCSDQVNPIVNVQNCTFDTSLLGEVSKFNRLSENTS